MASVVILNSFIILEIISLILLFVGTNLVDEVLVGFSIVITRECHHRLLLLGSILKQYFRNVGFSLNDTVAVVDSQFAQLGEVEWSLVSFEQFRLGLAEVNTVREVVAQLSLQLIGVKSRDDLCVGEVHPEVKQLLSVTKQSLYLGIENAVAGNHVGDIGFSIQSYCESHGFGVVRELVGHGIGKAMHEDPPVPNFGRRGNGVMLKEGMCIAIEPMITMGNRKIGLLPDKWGIATVDHQPAAHFEHTIVVRKGKAEILSSFQEVEHLEGQNF